MRQEGEITRWIDKRGFGFITNDEGEDSVFLHIKGFETKTRRPEVGDLVTYELAQDEEGRFRAENARLVSESAPAQNARSHSQAGGFGDSKIASLLTLVFLVGVIGAAAIGRLHYIVACMFLAVSCLTYLAYSLDKSSAQSGRWRIPEFNLHVLAMACGWPGALLAQRRLRHKSSKAGFLAVFWLTVVLNVAAVAYLVWAGEAGLAYQILDSAMPL